MLKIRLRRGGATHNPFYRIVVSDSLKTPAAATVEQQRRIGADLIVVGRQQRSAICGFLLGSTAQRVLARMDDAGKASALRSRTHAMASAPWTPSSQMRSSVTGGE